jgi:hypothetical protein
MEPEFITCAVCGNEKALKKLSKTTFCAPYGSTEECIFHVSECNNCKQEIVLDDYDSFMIPAINRSKKNSVINMIKFFEENKISKGNLERVFGLGIGSIDKYLEEEVIEPSFVMLLLTYRSHFPSLLKEADTIDGFNRGKFDSKEVVDINDKKMKRPLNVDLVCNLRVMGYSRESFRFISDEGDGYDILPGYMQGEGPELKPFHFEEWAEQLGYAADWCRIRSKELSEKTK